MLLWLPILAGPLRADPSRAAPVDPGTAPTDPVRIGVLSHRGADLTRQTWEPTADYLHATLPERAFEIVPLGFDEVAPAVAAGAVDFVLVNPGIYVALEAQHGVARIATMRNGRGPTARNRFGGVIFTRADQTDIARLTDLRERTLVAVAPTSFGGLQVAWGALEQAGLDLRRDPRALTFAGTHDAVVAAVLAGEADAGIVRTDILERLALAGQLDLAAVRVLNRQESPGFPLLHSTPLYPEWPFSSLRHTPEPLVEQVALALLGMPRDAGAAVAGGYSGWTVPLDYQPVHELLRTLHQAPYDRAGRFTLADALARYWLPLLVAGLLLLALAVLAGRVAQLNARLARAKTLLEQHQASILDSVAEGVYGVDRDGRTTFVNQAVERMTGWPAGVLIGRDQHATIHHSRGGGEAHPPENCPILATFRDGRPRLVEDDLFWRQDGSSFPVEYSVTPIQDRRGQIQGSVVVFRDTTDRRRAAERIRRLELEQAHVARLSTLGELASGIAHELNQPLTAISTNARACQRLLESGRASADTCAAVMDRIAGQAERAGEVIRHIRHFVRKDQPDMGPVAVTALLETVLALLRQDAWRHGVGMTAVIGHGIDEVLAQRTQIEQVLLNLGRNAIEALDAVPAATRRLHLSVRAAAGRVLFAVSDTGPGIAVAVRGRLFEPFVTDKPQGLGLGLSISAGICEAHRGRLAAVDRTGGGTRFEFSLPVAAPTAVPSAAVAPPAGAGPAPPVAGASP